MEIFAYIVVILAVVLILFSLTQSRHGSTMRLPQNELGVKGHGRGLDLGRLLPTHNFIEKMKLFAKLKRKVEAAHINLSPGGLFNLKILLMVGLAILVIVATGKADPLFVLIAMALGYFIPDIYLNKLIAKRKYQIVRRLPECVDLLGLCVEAGLDFASSVRWVIDKTPPTPINEEFAFVLEEVKWGKPRTQALKDMSRRLEIPEVSSFVQTIIQAERMGTPVAEAFAILSEDSRAQRFHRGERIALQAPIKILLPLIFFIMPVIGIVIGGPILLQFMQGGIGLK